MRFYIGFDPRDAAAYWVCRHSILEQTPGAEVEPLVLQHLRLAGFYGREADPLASTEFTYSRFMVPFLTGYRGWAVFMDGDMFARTDLNGLRAYMDDRKAVACVQHDYRPREPLKADGRPQTRYRRKNWSSLMLFNGGHPANAALTLEAVNRQTGAWLHQFAWLDDSLIGAIPEEWNWLEGWSPPGLSPKIVHYTRGIPGIHDGYRNAAYAEEYLDLARRAVLAPIATTDRKAA